LVRVYGERPAKGPIVFAVLWDREQEECVDAAMLEQSQNPGIFEEMHSRIKSIAYSTITFGE
jgi:hypothetical protein